MVNSDWKLVWSGGSQADLKRIYRNLLERTQSEEIATKVRKEIVQSVRELKINPYLKVKDRFRLDGDESYRAFEKHSYRISYQIFEEDQTFVVIRVRHARKRPLKH